MLRCDETFRKHSKLLSESRVQNRRERKTLATTASIDRAALVVLNAGYLANSHFCLIFSGEETMKKSIRFTFVLALLCTAMSSAMLAADNAYLYLVHGIPGLDVASTYDPQFPVDVLLNDEVCYIHGSAFGTITGPLTFEPGTYDVKISPANSLAPCSNSPLIDSTLSLDSGKSISAGAPALDLFTNNFSAVAANNARLTFALAADATAVQVIVENSATQKLYTYSVNPGALLDVTLPSGNYTVEVNQGTTTVVPATGLDLFSQSVTMLFAVGEGKNGTVTLQTRTVRNVI
jgi:hypothetical protein